MVAIRLVELFCQQYNQGLCDYPHNVCFASAVLDVEHLPVDRPDKIKIPREGELKVSMGGMMTHNL